MGIEAATLRISVRVCDVRAALRYTQAMRNAIASNGRLLGAQKAQLHTFNSEIEKTLVQLLQTDLNFGSQEPL
jgi:hypothetical protein